ncbi:complement factor properdin precursor, partial [Silurus asotus]
RHASWTSWSSWGACSMVCTEGVRQRTRACYGIGKCNDREGVGNKQTEPCEEEPCCPENGQWSDWSPWEPCSVTCEKGRKKRTRTCTNPPPKCHGSCEGSSDDFEICDTGIVCPTHGGWSAWGNWGACGGTCKVEGGFTPEQQRQRTCTNPSPSVEPRGNDCPGSSTDSQHCTHLPFCPVNGNWGPWLAFSECSVTCGVGQQTQNRNCDDPAPKHKGSACSGENSRTKTCLVLKNCPANGHWDEWSPWGKCESTSEREITCKNKIGRKRRTRSCVGRNYGGAPCDGDIITFEQCYDIEGCTAGPDKQIPQAIWSEWSKWGFCKPDCGENSIQTRTRKCIPDISKYRERRIEMFTGTPDISCQPLTGTEKAEENRPCLNLPKC